jgi:hypothetical protein
MQRYSRYLQGIRVESVPLLHCATLNCLKLLRFLSNFSDSTPFLKTQPFGFLSIFISFPFISLSHYKLGIGQSKVKSSRTE